MKKYLAYITFFLLSIASYLIGSKTYFQEQRAASKTNIREVSTKIKSVSQRLRDFDHKPIEERIAVYYQLKKDSSEFYNFDNEDELTMYGYSLLWSNQIDDAVLFFKLLVDEFPHSSNTYDSLGEAYLAQGKTSLSLINYQKALSMNPDNFYAEDQIAKILDPNFKELDPGVKFSKIYSMQDYRSDLDLLGQKILAIHPNALKFIDSLSFMRLIEEKKDQITNQTKFADFDTYCAEIIASINCSHTSSSSIDRAYSMIPKESLFPIKVRLIEDKLYVIDPLNNSPFLKEKDEIKSINNVAIDKLVEKIFKTIPSQGYVQSKKRQTFNTWASVLIPQALQYPETFKIKIKGLESSIFLDKNEQKNEIDFKASYPICRDLLCLDFLNDGKDAIMTIASFNYYPWNNLSEFVDFVDNAFNQIMIRGSQNLIIDLRSNGGGSPESSIHLLKYLIKKPFTYLKETEYGGENEIYTPFPLQFQGQVYFLIDGNGNSTTGHFMSMVKKHELGVTVGEELGSNHFCTAGQTLLRLPNTRLIYYLANSTSIADVDNLPDERGILPDYYVEQNIDDYFNDIDAVKKFALGLVEENRR